MDILENQEKPLDGLQQVRDARRGIPVALTRLRMRILMDLAWLTLALMLISASAQAQTTRPGATATQKIPASRPANLPVEKLDPDEKQVLELIRQMGAEKYKDRSEAYEKLKAMGADIIPLLQPHLKNPDPEIANRVARLMDASKWMLTGAMITRVIVTPPGEPHIAVMEMRINDRMVKIVRAEDLGLRVGDVIVRIDDADITRPEDIEAQQTPGQHTYHILRQGKVITFKVDGAVKDLWEVPWSVAKGGNDIMRGMLALDNSQYDLAFGRFVAAEAEGFDEEWAMILGAALGEYNLKHKDAMRLYAKARQAHDGDYTYISLPYESPALGSALISCHAAWLLGQSTLTKPAGPLFEQPGLSFCLEKASNLPLEEACLTKLSPAQEQVMAEMAYWRGHADQAWRAYKKDPKVLDPYKALDLCARRGDLDEATRIVNAAEDMRSRGQYTVLAMAMATAMATAMGRDDLARDLADKMLAPTLEAKDANTFLWEVSNANYNLWRRRGIEILCERVDLKRELWKDDKGIAFYTNRLASIIGRPGADPVAGLLPFSNRRDNDKGVETANVFRKDNAQRISTDWSALKQAVLVYDGPAGGRFVVSSASTVSYLDKDGGVHATTGLDGEMVPCELISCQPTGSVCIQGRQVYLYDEQARRWLSSYIAGRVEVDGNILENYRTPAFPLMLRHMIEKRPAGPYERWLETVKRDADGWTFWGFSDDLMVAVNEKTSTVVDVSAEMARQLKRQRPPAVYRSFIGPPRLLCTEAGLWAMEGRGGLRRLELPLPSNDVMVSIMPFPVVPAKIYVGVAPQQGGQVVEMDAKSLSCRLMDGGYCGFGPRGLSFAEDKSFAEHRMTLGMDYAVAELARQRQARAASQPASVKSMPPPLTQPSVRAP